VKRASALALAVLVPLLAGCETTAEKSARLARLAKPQARAQKGLAIARSNPHVEVRATAVLHDQNGTAAVVTLRSRARTPLLDVPIAITLKDAHGSTVDTNSAPGLAHPLVAVPLLTPSRESIWIDDQVQAAGAATVSVKVGEGSPATRQLPQISPEGAHLFEDPANGVGAEGTLVNHSSTAQQELVVFVIGTRAGRIVAAGRAVLPSVPAGASTPYRVFFVGSPRGAQLKVSAPPTTIR
jgi:hypothetical protein